MAESTFLRERRRLQERLQVESWWVDEYDLSVHLPWHGIRRILLPLANSEAVERARGNASWDSRHGRGPDSPSRSDDTADSDFLDEIPGTEVRFQDVSMRVRGSIDEVARTADGLEVIEYKTGLASVESPLTESQVFVYALALERLASEPVHRISVVSPQRSIEIPWDLEAHRRAQVVLEDARTATDAIARQSPENCHGCPVRHACDAYFSSAPDWWDRFESGPSTTDVWGVVVRATEEHDQLQVGIRRQDGADVVVRGVYEERAKFFDGNEQVGAYGLRATEARTRFGASLAPRSWHEASVGIASGLPPAWGTAWFRSSETSGCNDKHHTA